MAKWHPNGFTTVSGRGLDGRAYWTAGDNAGQYQTPAEVSADFHAAQKALDAAYRLGALEYAAYKAAFMRNVKLVEQAIREAKIVYPDA